MNIFITGGAGFIGANVAAHHMSRGHDVIVFDNLSRAVLEEPRLADAAAPRARLRSSTVTFATSGASKPHCRATSTSCITSRRRSR